MGSTPNIHDNPPAHAIDVDEKTDDREAQARDAGDPDAVPSKLIGPGESLS